MKTPIIALFISGFCLFITCLPAPPSAAHTNDLDANTTHTRTMAHHVPRSDWLDGTYECDTTESSPHARNVKWSAEDLLKLTLTECKQENGLRSKCTKMGTTQDAAIGICGQKGSFVMCPDAAWAATFIADKCKWELLAGGWYEFYDRPGIRIIVYHS